MNVLLLGSGGREHAIAGKLAQSPRLTKLFVCPGHVGMAEMQPAKVQCVPVPAVDATKLLALCQQEKITLCIIGPEQPLVFGVADALRQAGILVVGPGKEGARLEGSKVYSKRFMLEAGIPTAPAKIFAQTDLEAARAYLRTHAMPVVLKADGLAAGKGVTVAKTLTEALHALDEMFIGNRFGDAGQLLLIEEYMPGQELSYFILTDGRSAVALPEAQDHKRAYDGDQGPNTGGMGAYSPVPLATPALKSEIEDTIVVPTLAELARRGIDYKGFLFIGLMVGTDGKPRVIEYNCRLGDPETQAILPRLQEDLLELCFGAASGTLSYAPPIAATLPSVAATVVLATEGYPDNPQLGRLVQGVSPQNGPDRWLFEAGTQASPDGHRISTGGRVLAITGTGPTLAIARQKAYEGLADVQLEGSFYRKDIGLKA